TGPPAATRQWPSVPPNGAGRPRWCRYNERHRCDSWGAGMEFYAKVLVLALIQGAAELLPVSSSAHVILAQKLMGLDPASPSMVFLLIMLHNGTMFAAIVYFWSGWKAILFPPKEAPGTGRRFVMMILLATAVTGVLGLGLQ